MTVLQVKAFGDFDCPYTVSVCCGEKERIDQIAKMLNDFCKSLPECDKDVRLSNYLNNNKVVRELRQWLILHNFSYQQAEDFLDKLTEVCENEAVYIYKDAFSSDEIMQI